MLASVAESSSSPSMPTWASTVANLAAGATAGCAVEAALYPIDTIKTRLQAMIGGGGLQALLSSGGGKALYAGVVGNLVGVAPSSAIFMAFYEPVKQAVHQSVSEDKQYLGPVVAGAQPGAGRQQLQPAGARRPGVLAAPGHGPLLSSPRPPPSPPPPPLRAGALAGAAASITRVPTEVVKQRLQTGEFTGAINTIRAIIAREGFRGLCAPAAASQPASTAALRRAAPRIHALHTQQQQQQQQQAARRGCVWRACALVWPVGAGRAGAERLACGRAGTPATAPSCSATCPLMPSSSWHTSRSRCCGASG
jgi:hypothetical protein